MIADLIPDQPFIRTAPAFLVFLANGRRLPEIAKMRGKPFPNDHLDQFFNAAVDAGIVLATFIRAADAVGLGTCPISVIRDHSAKVSEMLGLPQRVIPVAGMCVGWPSEAGHISARLSLASTVHDGQIRRRRSRGAIDAYDRRRAAIHPYKPRDPARWGDVRSTAGRRTRRGNTACRSARTSARSCGRRVQLLDCSYGLILRSIAKRCVSKDELSFHNPSFETWPSAAPQDEVKASVSASRTSARASSACRRRKSRRAG